MSGNKLSEIGFYTLTDERAKNASVDSPLYRCELLITDRCNFNCPYCRKRSGPDIEGILACGVLLGWGQEGIKNVRFSGGEPTCNPHLIDLVSLSRLMGMEHIALSTNGSADKDLYKALLKAGVNDFSVSLDACCASTGDTMAGVEGKWNKVIESIKFLAENTYVTVGIVLTETNSSEAKETVMLAHDLGVADIRIIPAAQVASTLPLLDIPDSILDKHPILKYRINNLRNNKPVRGITETDSHKCPLVLDDMAIDEQGFHYPCIIYLRERGNPIGKFEGNMKEVRQQRKKWFDSHNSFNDSICRKNCLDVCVDYNNRCRDLGNNKE